MFIFDFAWHWVTGWLFGWGGIAALVAAGAWVVWWFTRLSLALHIAIAATVFVFGSTYIYTSGYNQGRQVTINEVAANTKETKDAITKAGQSIDDCNARNGTWDTVSGVCQ